MWRPVFALVVIVGVICASVVLYQNRQWLFRPDISRTGGTRLVLRVEGDPAAVAVALAKRFDPMTTGAVAVTEADGGLWLDVPSGRAHDETLARVKRLASRRGRLWLGTVAEEAADAAAVKAARAWLVAPANAKARKTCEDTGKPPPAPAEGYAWAAISQMRATRQGFIMPAVPGGPIMKGAPAAAGPDFVSHPYKTAGPLGDGFFALVREAERGERVGNGDVVLIRRHSSSGPGYTQLHIKLSPEGAGRRASLQRRIAPGSRVALILDGEMLTWFQNAASSEYNYILPMFETDEQADDVRALIGSPLPEGASVEVAEERAVTPR